MFKTAAFALTATLIAAATPAFANPVRTAPDPSSEPAEMPTDAATPEVKPTRYCIKDYVTGSHLMVKQCNTRKDWLAQGFDPLAK